MKVGSSNTLLSVVSDICWSEFGGRIVSAVDVGFLSDTEQVSEVLSISSPILI